MDARSFISTGLCKCEVRLVRASLGTEGSKTWLVSAQQRLVPVASSDFQDVPRHWAFSAKEIADVFRAKFPGLVVPCPAI